MILFDIYQLVEGKYFKYSYNKQFYLKSILFMQTVR